MSRVPCIAVEVAKDLAAEAKMTFKFVTDDQMQRVKDFLVTVPDWPQDGARDVGVAEFVRATFTQLVLQSPNDQLFLSQLRAAVLNEVRRRGLMPPTAEDTQRAHRREQERAAMASWGQIDALIDDLTDDDLADLRPLALAKLNRDAQRMFENKGVRESKTLRGLVYEVVREQQAPQRRDVW